MNAATTQPVTELTACIARLRPKLLRHARERHGIADPNDAEDLVSETTLAALQKLDRFVPNPAVPGGGLLAWLQGIMRYSAATQRKKAALRVRTVPIDDETRNIPAPPDPGEGSSIEEIDALPPEQRLLVYEWLRGYSQTEIAQRTGWHRNTVGNRLELAFERLKVTMPDIDCITYSFSLINYCSRVTVYHRPTGVWRSWFSQGPPDIRFKIVSADHQPQFVRTTYRRPRANRFGSSHRTGGAE